MKIHKIELTERQVTLVRVALLQRIDRLRDRSDCKSSYDDMVTLLLDGPLSLAALNITDTAGVGIRKKKHLTIVGTDDDA